MEAKNKDATKVVVNEGDGINQKDHDLAVAQVLIKFPLQASETFKRVVHTDNDLKTADLIRVMKEIGRDVSNGKMDYLEQTLCSQVVLLDALFNNLTARALGSEYQKNFENVLKLALKAQAQARCTAEALALIKNPQPYIRQANIAQGHQQVNNTYAPMPSNTDVRAGEETSNEPSKLLEEIDAERLDTRKTTETGRVDSELAALA